MYTNIYSKTFCKVIAFYECFKIMQASAVINGRQQVGVDDFKALIYVLWDKEEQIPIIESSITKMINPFDDQFKGFKDNFAAIRKDIDNCNDENEKSTKSLEAKGSIGKMGQPTAKFINNGQCIACCQCAMVCPDGCIEVYRVTNK